MGFSWKTVYLFFGIINALPVIFLAMGYGDQSAGIRLCFCFGMLG
jgi:hypothetical protein